MTTTAAVTPNRQTGTMTDVTVTSTQLTTGKWVFGDAQADPVTGRVNTYNKAMAKAAQMALSNDEQIVLIAGEVKANTATLEQMNSVRNMKVSDWSTLSEADKKARSDILKAQSVPLTTDAVAITLPGAPSTTLYANDPPLPFIVISIPSGSEPSVRIPQDITRPADLARFMNYGQRGKIYSDDAGHTFYFDAGGNINLQYTSQGTYRSAPPTEAELTSWQSVLQKATDKLTQFSQTEQARLQQFVTQKSMWEGLVSSLMQLLARIRNDIAAKF
ncbi:hypothetical protein [Caenimonas koreensis]|uniref:hypothetical protein n=1 Tax=Caenimonas koreensis TaxID=367474 RepID=UPI003784C4F2